MEESSSPHPGRLSGQSSDSHQIRKYWLMLLERRWLVFCTFFVVVALGALYAFRSTPIYEAFGRIQIDPENAGVLSSHEGPVWGIKDTDYLQTQYKSLVSRTLIEAVIQKLKLDEDPRYALAEDPIEAVGRDIDVEPIRLTRLVIIKAKHTDPRRAADMVNTLMDLYLIQNQDRKVSKAFAGLNMLKQEAEVAERDVISSMVALQKYRVDKGMISLVDNERQIENVDALAFRTAQDDLGRQSIITDQAQKIADEAEKWKAAGHPIADFYAVNQDRLVTEVKARIGAAESLLAERRTRYKDAHPQVAGILSGLEADRKKLEIEAQRAFESIFSTLQVEKAREAQSRAKRALAEKRMQDLNEAKMQYDVLSRKKERNEFFYQQILAKTREFNLNTKDTLANIFIEYRAVPRTRASKPNRPLILAASIIMGMGLALALAFFVSLLDDSIKSQEDVENYLGANFLGYIPRIKVKDEAERGLHTHLKPTSTASEGFRTMRAAISLARNTEKLSTITITSTMPEEGKSLFASNFAIVTAQTGVKTLLVDADLRRPVLHKIFKLQSTAGLSAYLSDRVRSVDEIVHSTDVPNLSVVCCGRVPSNPSELLGSKRMQQFLEEASTSYGRIILDCAPVSAVADPLVVAAMTDGVIYVTKFNKVRRENALRSVQRLLDAGIRLVGIAVNDIDFEGRDAYYHNFHYHQNQYYASHYAKQAGQDEKSSKARQPQETTRS